MRPFHRSLIAGVIAGALTCAAPPAVKPLVAQQSGAKKKVKKAGASSVKETARDMSPNGVTAQCDDGTWTKTTKRTGACVTHGGVASVVCPGALCKP